MELMQPHSSIVLAILQHNSADALWNISSTIIEFCDIPQILFDTFAEST